MLLQRERRAGRGRGPTGFSSRRSRPNDSYVLPVCSMLPNGNCNREQDRVVLGVGGKRGWATRKVDRRAGCLTARGATWFQPDGIPRRQFTLAPGRTRRADPNGSTRSHEDLFRAPSRATRRTPGYPVWPSPLWFSPLCPSPMWAEWTDRTPTWSTSSAPTTTN